MHTPDNLKEAANPAIDAPGIASGTAALPVRHRVRIRQPVIAEISERMASPLKPDSGQQGTLPIRVRHRTRSPTLDQAASHDSAPDAMTKLQALLLNDLKPMIVERPISEIRGYANNPRNHSDRQIIQLAAAILEFGFINPIIIGPDFVIVAGHGRLAAAKHLGLLVVPTIEIKHLDEKRLKAFRIADNRLAELAEWDDDLLRIELLDLTTIELDFNIELTGFASGQIDLRIDSVTEKVKADPADDIPAIAGNAVSRQGDLWLMDRHRLICGSALDAGVLETLMAGVKARTIFTDPPYNVAVQGHVSGLGKVKHREFAMASGEMSKAEFTDFLARSLGCLASNLVDGGIAYVCMDWRHMGELLEAIPQAGLTLLNLCVWTKDNGGMGSFYRSQHELVFVCKKGTAPHRNLVELGRHGRYRTNVWSYAGVNTMKKGRTEELAMHPTVKPVSLVADAIRDCTNRNEWVLDGFGGSGSTLIAAEKSGRCAALVEIDPLYCDVIIRRFEKLTGTKAILAETGETFADVAIQRTE